MDVEAIRGRLHGNWRAWPPVIWGIFGIANGNRLFVVVLCRHAKMLQCLRIIERRSKRYGERSEWLVQFTTYEGEPVGKPAVVTGHELIGTQTGPRYLVHRAGYGFIKDLWPKQRCKCQFRK